jgi:hypothetical protein
MPHGGSKHAVTIPALVVAALLLLVVLSSGWFFRHGYVLYYGDAQAHLDDARRIIDSRTPGYDQLGTVWLPMLPVLLLPFVGNDWLWSTGLAGTIPVGLCFVVLGLCFFLVARELYDSFYIAGLSLACLVLNPNLLYLAAIPMTEVVFLAALLAELLAILKYRSTGNSRWFALAVLASWSMSLTRYDGWFLIPFIGLALVLGRNVRNFKLFLIFAMLAAVGPLYWIGNSWWETGNALDFYNGPYSAKAIQQSKWYPGLRDWLQASHYYFKACQLCSGTALIVLGIVGSAFSVKHRKIFFALAFLCLTPAFYIWSMHSSGGTPIYLPQLWPFSYYNIRYGIGAVPLCALAVGSIALRIPERYRRAAILLPLVAITPWLVHPSPEKWICWKESEVNSVDRRAWTASAATFLNNHYLPGQGILTSAGDVSGIYCRNQIHLSETINIGNGSMWFAATRRPDLFHPMKWAVLQDDDGLAKSLAQTSTPYKQVASFTTSKYSPTLRILEKSNP